MNVNHQRFHWILFLPTPRKVFWRMLIRPKTYLGSTVFHKPTHLLLRTPRGIYYYPLFINEETERNIRYLPKSINESVVKLGLESSQANSKARSLYSVMCWLNRMAWTRAEMWMCDVTAGDSKEAILTSLTDLCRQFALGQCMFNSRYSSFH